MALFNGDRDLRLVAGFRIVWSRPGDAAARSIIRLAMSGAVSTANRVPS